jgi:hypothetical protein
VASTTEIANIALSNIGVGKEIANLDTEQSAEANACRRFFETAKKATLSDLDWSFATKCAVLNLVEEGPNTEWKYSYRYPVDAISIRRVVSDIRNDTSLTRVPLKITRDGSGKLILTDRQNAEAEYTENITDPGFFTPEFDLALSFRLAYYIAPRLTGGDPFQLQNRMIKFYELELNQAKKTNINEQVPDLPPESEFIETRS